VAAGYGVTSRGPGSFRAEYRRRAGATLDAAALEARTGDDDVVTEEDVAALPAPVASYVRWSGAVGRPRVRSFRARVHGRIRGGADEHRLVDFVSDDRFRSSPDGRAFTRQRWSTPLVGHRGLGGRRLATWGEGRWHAPAPEGEFAYLEFGVDDITYDPSPPEHPR
jgi:hypothetical protein